MKKVALLLVLFSLVSSLWSEEISLPTYTLRGHLREEHFIPILQQAEGLAEGSRFLLQLESSSGDLEDTLRFAEKLFLLRQKKELQLVTYIQTALGPAALLPFLAEELQIHPLVLWGDIYAGAERAQSFPLLYKRLEALLPTHKMEGEFWKGMLKEMLGRDREESSSLREPLILNRGEIERVGILHLLNDVELSDVNGEERFSNLEKKWQEHFAGREEKRVGHLVITDLERGIDRSTWIYIQKGLKYYRERGALCIFLELNTPGGEVFSALQIARELRQMDVQYGIPVIAYIHPWAISAGALLAYSCRYVVVSSDASMGAAAPISANSSGESVALGEKVKSPLRTQFANSASFYGRNPLLAKAMVDQDLILVERFGKIIALNNMEEMRNQGPHADEPIISQDKLLTLTAEQLMRWEVADALLSSSQEALHPIYSLPFFSSQSDLFLEEYQIDRRTQLLSFLSHPVLSSLLSLIFFLGLYMEISTPSFGVAGILSLFSGLLLLFTQFSREGACWVDLLIFITGALCLLIEIFITPGFGLLGSVGVILLLLSLFLFDLPSIESLPDVTLSSSWLDSLFIWMDLLSPKLSTFLLFLAGGGVLCFFFVRFFLPYLSRRSSFIHRDFLLKEENEERTIPSSGLTLTPLLPSGRALFGKEICSVISEGEYIEKGERVITVGEHLGTLLVRKER